jgi:hypothetical protein
MRYIKLFESFSNIDRDKLKENIAACLVELFDKDFEILIIVDNRYINISIERKGDENEIEGDPNLYTGYDFELYEIEDEIRQVCDYISEMYDNVTFEYIPETRWDNPGYSKLEQIPDGLVLTRFDLYVHVEKSVLRTYEIYEQEDKDYLGHKASSGVNRHGFSTGFLKDEEGLKEIVRNIFIELEDTNHRVFIDVDKLSIVVDIEPIFKDEIVNEIYDYSVDYDIAKECSESFVEYIKERNPNIDSRVGLNVKYNIEYYENVYYKDNPELTKYKNWSKKSFTEFPGEEWRDKIFQLKIILSV